jgi:hypothetical protein
MSASPNSPRLLKGGIVVVDPFSGAVQRVIALQYNPDSVTRTLQVQAHSEGGSGDVSEALRLKGPAVETIKLEAEMDAVDYLEKPDQNPNAVQYGLHPQLAALEALVNPTSAHLVAVNGMAGSGSLEIIPAQAPLTVFVWGGNRAQPVRITDFSVTEEVFDPALNPIRVKLNLGLRVLSVADVGFDNFAGGLYMSYLRGREAMAQRLSASALSVLGIGSL